MPTRRQSQGERSQADQTQTRRDSYDDEDAYEESYADEDTYEDDDRDTSHADVDEAAPALTAASAAKAGLQHIVELTGREPAGVTSLEPADDSGWLVGVEVIEDRRVPSSTDVLALYEVKIDTDGRLLAYRRKRRYSRGQAGEES